MPPRRILVVGIPGAGKSTFARALAARTGLPLIHLDQEFWHPGWVVTPRDAWRAKQADFVARDAWIMEGNYDNSLDIRAPRADCIVWFDTGRGRALWRIARRIATSYGRVRPDMAPGCPEQIDAAFLRYIWTFDDEQRPRVAAALRTYAPDVNPIMIGSDAAAARVLATFGAIA